MATSQWYALKSDQLSVRRKSNKRQTQITANEANTLSIIEVPTVIQQNERQCHSKQEIEQLSTFHREGLRQMDKSIIPVDRAIASSHSGCVSCRKSRNGIRCLALVVTTQYLLQSLFPLRSLPNSVSSVVAYQEMITPLRCTTK